MSTLSQLRDRIRTQVQAATGWIEPLLVAPSTIQLASQTPNLRDRVKAVLQDASADRWSTDDLDEAIRRTLELYSDRNPHQAIVAFEYDLIAYSSGSIKQNSRAAGEQRYVSLLNGSITDGAIVVTPAATSFSTSAPLVAIDPNNECPDCTTVIATNVTGAAEAMGYLMGLGHRRIGFIGGRLDLRCAQQRLEGYRAALAGAGIAVDPALITTGDFTRASGRDCAQQLLSLADPPTAIFAANDQSAFGAIDAAIEMGRRVPDDLSVVGFDNISESGYCTPPLTTIDQFIERMGYVATQLLIGLIQGQSTPGALYEMPTQLIERASCRQWHA